ncbi:hypothetical protein J1605_010819 [Eschrichtius robustus]|uniref:Uncharacterized protein n=1 Tax=Eschrichtius robustus TaxID=9764 RepID=A0AB34GT58_ESCRO|nr:hypothetical protein J1605_010819 [Eschrichtius robustus]
MEVRGGPAERSRGRSRPAPRSANRSTRSAAGRGCGDAGAASLPAGPPPSAAAGPRRAELPPAWEPGPAPGPQEGFLGGTRGPGRGAAERAAPGARAGEGARRPLTRGRPDLGLRFRLAGSSGARLADPRRPRRRRVGGGRRAAEGGPAAAPAGPCTAVPTAGGRRASSRLPLNRRGGRGAQQTRFPRGAHAQAAPAPGSALSPALPPSLLPPLSPKDPSQRLSLRSSRNPSPSLHQKAEKESGGWNAPCAGGLSPPAAPSPAQQLLCGDGDQGTGTKEEKGEGGRERKEDLADLKNNVFHYALGWKNLSSP